jgi:phenylacetate-coenzyme A ligase PaaK-like adenylate-forming protein
LNDFDNLPVLNRLALSKVSTNEILTKSFGEKHKTHRTSGSTGIPLNMVFSKWEYFLKDFDFLKCYFQSGVNPFHWTIALRDPVDIKKPNILQKIGFFRHFYINVFESYDSSLESLILKFRNKTIILKGYASDLMYFADKNEHFKSNNIRVSLIITDSEVLEDYMADKLQTSFNSPILNTYASVECGLIAKKLYGIDKSFVVSQKVRVDILQGNEGFNRIILTKLGKHLMPIIKYEIGDFTFDIPQKDAKTIDSRVGKYISVLNHKDGHLVSGHLIKQEISNNFPEIKRFQVIQNDRYSILIKITPIEGDSNFFNLLGRVKDKIISLLGDMDIEVVIEDLMSPRNSRKFQVIINNSNKNMDEGSVSN